jgi:hypothetical protein
MNSEPNVYPHRKQLTLAGCMTLVTLATAVVYACHATPYTMVLFMGGGWTLLAAAVILFGWTIWNDVHARLTSIGIQQFLAGQVIYRQGDPAEHVFVITKGKVEAVRADPVKGDVVVGQFERDDFFGETAVLSRLPRQVTARAVDAVDLLVIHRADFLNLYSSLPRLRARIEAEQAQRHARVNQAGGRP